MYIQNTKGFSFLESSGERVVQQSIVIQVM